MPTVGPFIDATGPTSGATTFCVRGYPSTPVVSSPINSYTYNYDAPLAPKIPLRFARKHRHGTQSVLTHSFFFTVGRTPETGALDATGMQRVPQSLW